jgi:hypothetical protein
MSQKKELDLASSLEQDGGREKALLALTDALTATRSFAQNGKTVKKPDFKTRVLAAELILGYTDGKPIERQQILVSQAERKLSEKEHNAAIARALRLPEDREKKIVERFKNKNRRSSGPTEAPPPDAPSSGA